MLDLTTWAWVTMILAVILVLTGGDCSPEPGGRAGSECSSSP